VNRPCTGTGDDYFSIGSHTVLLVWLTFISCRMSLGTVWVRSLGAGRLDPGSGARYSGPICYAGIAWRDSPEVSVRSGHYHPGGGPGQTSWTRSDLQCRILPATG